MRRTLFTFMAGWVALAFAAVAFAAVPSSEGFLDTKDGVRIAYEHYKAGSGRVVIICPGFFNSKDNRWMEKAVGAVYPERDVIIFDFRGHGASSGEYTWSAREPMDVDAVLDYAKSGKYGHVGMLAFSLGAAAAVNAVSRRDDVDSMVLISCPYRFGMIDFHFWEPAMLSDLMDNIACKWQGKGARAGNFFLRKEDPVDSIGKIKKAAILFIQGKSDWVIKDRHAKKLYDAAGPRKKLEMIEGGLHAERMIEKEPERMKKLISGWFDETL